MERHVEKGEKWALLGLVLLLGGTPAPALNLECLETLSQAPGVPRDVFEAMAEEAVGRPRELKKLNKEGEAARREFFTEALFSQGLNAMVGHSGTKTLGFLVQLQSNKAHDAAETILRAGDTQIELVTLRTGEKGWRVHPDKDGSPLNRFAHDVKEAYGTDVVYSAGILFQAGGGFRASDNTLFLSHQAVHDLQPTHIEVHEKLHALFDALKREAIFSPFHIEFMTVDKDGSLILDGAQYRNYLSADEISAYTLTITIAVSRIRKLLADGAKLDDAEIQSELKTLKQMTGVGQKIMTRSAQLARDAAKALKRETDLKKGAFREVTNASGKKIKYFEFELTVNGVEVLVPGPTEMEARALEAELRKRIADGQKIVAPPAELVRMIIDVAVQRLRTLEATGSLGANGIAAIEKGLDGWKTNDDLAPVGQLVKRLNLEINGQIPKLPPRSK